MLWIALAVMTGLAMGFALWPLAFRRSETSGESREAAFYRAQLAEIARDVERGQLPPEEAASARAEAGRRLLTLDASQTPAPSSGLWRRRLAAAAIFLVVPVVALAIYVRIGAPDLPDAPLASRKPDINTESGIEAAVAKIEAKLIQTPNDRRGWEVLAPVYMRLGRYADAAGAYRRVLALGGDGPQLHADLGEAYVAMADSVVTTDAREQFDKAGDLPESKFYLALAAEQDGKKDDALAVYKALAPQATGRAPWMVGLRSRLAELSGEKPKAAPAFTDDQRKMIAGMVSGLADRLAKQGGNAEEWARLIRAYSVLHEQDKARDALASARKALGANADIDALARELGI